VPTVAGAIRAPVTLPDAPASEVLRAGGLGGGKSFTMEEVKQHNTRKSAWVAIDGRVYDVTSFVDKHPGGALPMLELIGLDGTDPFMGFHGPEVIKRWLPLYYIGDVADWHVTPLEADYRRLRKDLEDR
jgi:cytochrome b involved in lipid metabolism